MTNAEKMYAWICDRFDEGRTVHVCTYLKAIAYKPKHRDMFRLSKDGKCVLAQNGKRWNDITFAKLTAH